jgi:hypothetical protein
VAPAPQTTFLQTVEPAQRVASTGHALKLQLATEWLRGAIDHAPGVSREVAWKTRLLASAANEAAAAGDEFEAQSQLAGGLG